MKKLQMKKLKLKKLPRRRKKLPLTKLQIRKLQIKKRQIKKKLDKTLFVKKSKYLFYKRFTLIIKTVKRYAFLSWGKKKNFFLKILRNNDILKNFIFINLIQKRKNVFFNYTDFYGKTLKKYSVGLYSKKSQRKVSTSIELLFNKIISNAKDNLNNIKKIYFFNINSKLKGKGIKKMVNNFITSDEKGFMFYKINRFNIKSHNGVRKKKQRRK